jgi:HAD superfamily hydrolase (TIGR01549 family)
VQIERTAKLIDKQPEVVEQIVDEWMQRRPGKWLYLFRRRKLLAEIRAFRQQGGLAALVSDYPASVKLKALRADELFDAVVANGEPGGPQYLKPSPEGYLLAARRLGVEPSECLVIGDRQDADGEAARRAGMGFRRI